MSEMLVKYCAAEGLYDVLKIWSGDRDVFLPVDNSDGDSVWQKFDETQKMSNKLNTVKSPKNFFFPQSEDLMKFKTEGKNIEIEKAQSADGEFVIFGCRACDARAFDVLDNVFLAEPADTYYADKREKGIIITLACDSPAETCFCTTFGIDPTNPAGDISCWRDKDNFYFRANTEKGEILLKGTDILQETDDGRIEEIRQDTRGIFDKLPLAKLTTDGFGAGKTMELFDNKCWDTLSESCLGCGTCTFVCPTCQCYDIRDFKTNNGVVRYRCWDSCMYSDFTLMAAGQPRLTQKERFRQRFMHKLVYYPENNDGMFSCVGCGRCVAKCPVSLNIAKVMRTIQTSKEENTDE